MARTLRKSLRPHDLIIRYGGDEFLCTLQGVDLVVTSPRFAQVNALLAASSAHGSVTIGLALLRPDDTSDSLIAHADARLYERRNA